MTWPTPLRKGGIPRKRNEDGVPVCRRGHSMTPENTYIRLGREENPECRECRRGIRRSDDYTRPARFAR